MSSPFVSKLACHRDRLAEWLRTGDAVPVTWELDLTNKCQHRCFLCHGGRYPIGAHMTDEQIDGVIEQVAALGGRGLIFTGGGEPTLHDHLDAALALTKTSGMDAALITNGGASPRSWDAAVTYCTWLRFSLDAWDAVSYKRTHGVGKAAWKQVLAAIESCVAQDGQADVGVAFLCDAVNEAGMVAAARLARELGVDYFQVRPYHTTPKMERQRLDVERIMTPHFWERLGEAQALSTVAFSVFASLPKYRRIQDKDFARNYRKCWGQSFATTIAADCRLYICCHARANPWLCLGDLNEATLEEIWSGPKRRRVVDSLNLDGCVPLCRCDAMNEELESIRQTGSIPDSPVLAPMHAAFL